MEASYEFDDDGKEGQSFFCNGQCLTRLLHMHVCMHVCVCVRVLLVGDERMETDSEGDEDEAQIHEDGEPVEGTMDETMMEFKDDSVQGFFAHQSPIYATAVHPSQPFALTGGHDDRAFLWHVKTGEPVFNSFESKNGPQTVDFVHSSTHMHPHSHTCIHIRTHASTFTH